MIHTIEIEELECYNCGHTIMPDSEQTFDGDIWCDECYTEYIRKCRDCGEFFNTEDGGHNVYGDWYCDTCYDDQFYECECGNIVRIEDTQSDDDGNTFCESCYRSRYTVCCNCDHTISRDDAHENEDGDYFCDECWEEERARHPIHEYGYAPDNLIFYHDVNDRLKLHLGIEVEYGVGGFRQEIAMKVNELMNLDGYESHVWCQRDASLHPRHSGRVEGFEMAAMPATLEKHMDNTVFKWRQLLQMMKDNGYRSHDCGYCGIHVHVDNAALGSTRDEVGESRLRIIVFVMRYWNQMLQFSRRTEDQMREWASNYDYEKRSMCRGDDKVFADMVKKSPYDFARHKCVNVTNEHTTEIRMFRGTLNYDTFIAIPQFVDTMVRYCLEHDVEYINAHTWSDFMEYASGKYTELDAYMHKRGLDCVRA